MTHVQYLETDTARLKQEIVWAESGTGDMFEVVDVSFAREQEAEIELLRSRLHGVCDYLDCLDVAYPDLVLSIHGLKSIRDMLPIWRAPILAMYQPQGSDK